MNQAALTRPLKKLLDQWAELEPHWRDARGQEFYQSYVSDLPRQVQVAGYHLQQLETLLRQLRHECE